MEQLKVVDPRQDVEVMDLAAFKAAYGPWLESVRERMEAGDFKEAFKTYPFPQPADAPWTPFTKELGQCKVAVLSTAGLYLEGEQTPFDAPHIEGDWTFREVPTDTPAEKMGMAHTHFDHGVAEQDLNSVLPLDRLRELQAEGVIGELLSPFFSITGYCTRADKLTEETAPAIVARLQEMGADVLLNIPI
ncbi:MAG: glycine/sarcosine/betaine reductase selenoprotein B family protein [SAR324 cluster bacterium]|nr:glycine/sarcosine/betaine reductase selenoprotein B family protein [SAR324 cluster bacterium]